MAVRETMRRWPVPIWLFTVIVLLWQVAYLALDTSYVDEHPVWSVAWTAFGLASLAALVVWRQQWAWWLFLLGPIVYWVSPAWGAHFHPLWDLVELAIAGLLLSPSMRGHVFTGRRRRRIRPARPWLVPLALSGALTVLIALPERHPVEHTVGARVATWTIFWLLLAAAMRSLGYVVGKIRRLLGRRSNTPPAAGSES